ncbi:MAG: SusC/RagA family TonB-linked outer membrane protein [Pedobacter sp.]|uniref:SusC/RagA family TonB-linked outer membrane protein n=1 Tax=Pedobacter sp. TaxID=1411316 RepID=UPI003567F26C
MYKISHRYGGISRTLLFKIMLIMRLTTVILIASILQVSASTYGQQITINRKNVSIESLLKEIRTQSQYDFFYDGKIIPKNKLVDISLKNADINEALKKVLAGSALSYRIEGKIITIKKQTERTMIDKIISVFEQIDVRGKVVDENGKPLPGASVFVEDSNNRTITNEKGEFYLKNVSDNAKIFIGYVGYQPLEIDAARDLGTIKMKSSTGSLEEVEIKFNTGYQQLSRERSAGSFAKPNLNVMKNRSTSPNILDRLEGLVPGLSSGRSDLVAEGQRGGLVIRGASSINLSTKPLVVVDGIEVPNIETVNMQDVEDITILKDATSASIWGAKAANGVIVITTKKGQAGDQLRIDYDGYYAFQGRPNREYLPRLGSSQFIAAQREIFPEFAQFNPYDGEIAEGALPPHLQILYDALPDRGILSQAQANFKLDSLSKLDNRKQINDIFFRNAATLNQTLSISGGGKVHSFYGSLNHIGSNDNAPGSRNNQYKVNLRNDFIFGKRFSAFINADLTNTVIRSNTVSTSDGPVSVTPDDGFLPYQLFKDAKGNPLVINVLAPVALIGYADEFRNDYATRAGINLDYSPVQEMDRQYQTNNTLSSRFVAGGKIDILKNLSFQGTYGYNIISTAGRNVLSQDNYRVRDDYMRFTQEDEEIDEDEDGPLRRNLPKDGGRLLTNNSVTKGWTIRNQLFFNQDWDQHQLTVMAGQEATHVQTVDNNATYFGWDDQLQVGRPVNVRRLVQGFDGIAGRAGWDGFENNVGGREQPIARTTSYFANLGYTFAGKYTLNSSWRIDQSNLFGFDKSAQNRPVYSVGGKWAMGTEQFLDPVNWLDRLDLRLTFGVTGNAPTPGMAASRDIFESEANVNYVNGVGIVLTTPANAKLTWESTKVYNAGIDFSVLNGRLDGSIDLYLKNTQDLIGTLFTSPLTGYSSVTGNFGNLKNKGIDLQLNSVNLRSRDFEWGTSLVLGYNKNKITKLNINPATTGDALINATYLVGYPMFVSHSYNYAGLNADGDPQIRLADGSLTSDPNISLPADILYNGVTQAPLSGGLSNNFRYKNFQLGVNIIYNGGHVMLDPRNPLNANDPGFLNRFKIAGDENKTNIPRWIADTELASERNTSYYTYGKQRVMDASYAKIRDITLGYSLPQMLVSKMKAQAISFRFQLSNLLLWTANDINYDPEASGYTRAAQGTVTFGAHITF